MVGNDFGHHAWSSFLDKTRLDASDNGINALRYTLMQRKRSSWLDVAIESWDVVGETRLITAHG